MKKLKVKIQKMKVNFNNLRKQAVYRYNILCQKLNAATRKSNENDYLDGYGWVSKGCIVIEADDIQKEMDDLRMMIGSIAMVYEEGSEEFANVYEEIYPEGAEKKMESFNEEV